MTWGGEKFRSFAEGVRSDAAFCRHFELLEPLGAGGMGLVVRARQIAFDRHVAIKFLIADEEFREECRRRFQTEARAMGKLLGPHFVGLLHADVLSSGIPYLAMELLDGNDLERELTHRDHLRYDEVARIGAQTAQALFIAHDLGIVHRDVKPANLFRQRNGDVKILDFGVSRIVVSAPPELKLTRTGAIVGSPCYVSPDQLRNASTAGPPADVWSLGATLFHLTTGFVPFPGSTLLEIFDAIRYSPHRDPRELRQGTPSALAELINECLAKEPKARVGVLELQQRLARLAGYSGQSVFVAEVATSQTLPAAVAPPQLAKTIAERVSTGQLAAQTKTNSGGDTLRSPTDHTATRPNVATSRRPTTLRSVAIIVGGVGTLVGVSSFGLELVLEEQPRRSHDSLGAFGQNEDWSQAIQPILVTDAGTNSDASADIAAVKVSNIQPTSDVQPIATSTSTVRRQTPAKQPASFTPTAPSSTTNSAPRPGTTAPAGTERSTSQRVRKLDETISW